jgi:peroxiredoxin
MRLELLLSCGALLLGTAAAAPPLSPPGAPAPTTPTPLERSTPVLPGASAPDFILSDLGGRQHQLSDLTAGGKIVVLEWFSPDCPSVAKYRADSSFMQNTADYFDPQKVVWLAIDSSPVQTDGQTDTAAIEQFGRDNSLPATVLLDRQGTVGRRYGVTLTPTLFVIDRHGVVLYSGAPDNSTALDRLPGDTNYLKAAISAAMVNKTPGVTQTTPTGCRIDYAALPPPAKAASVSSVAPAPAAPPVPSTPQQH